MYRTAWELGLNPPWSPCRGLPSLLTSTLRPDRVGFLCEADLAGTSYVVSHHVAKEGE